MIIIYSDTISPRLVYTLNVLFKYVLGVDYKLTRDFKYFKRSLLFKINYSSKAVEDSLQIVPSILLFEKGYKEQIINVEWEKDIPFFFKTKGDLPFDILASTFYMISRYEEYLSFEPDVHNRFKAEDSLAFKQGFLKKPVVNLWAKKLQETLVKLFPNIVFPKKEVSYLNTLDIDMAYAYKAKGVFKFLGGFVKSIIKNNKEDIENRKLYLRTKKDPFDTYDFIKNCSENIKTHYFFLLGDRGQYDPNIHYYKRGLKKLILKLNKEHEIGIHPSYQSNKEPKRVLKEIKRLEKILKEKVEISRQHFLKMSFPETYENLINQNIKKDYSLGFASQIGFRGGICSVYPFYNLETELQRPLWIVPFEVMDGTLNNYLSLEPVQALKEVESLIAEVKNVNGLFVPLWHNSSLSETGDWKGWRQVYKEMLTLMK